MNVWVWSLASVIIVSLLSLIGVVTLALRKEWLQNILVFLVSFAVGALFGDAFIHIIPDLYEKPGEHLPASSSILSGIILFFVLEKFIYWRHCHSGHCDMHEKPVVWLNLLGDGVHNFIDGMIIAASYSTHWSIGIATTVAVVLHEIPQEIGDFGILLHGGLSRGRALALNFLCSLLSILGAVMGLALGSAAHDFTPAALGVAAGGFIYLAGSDLIPELHREIRLLRSLGQLAALLFGILLMALLVFIE